MSRRSTTPECGVTQHTTTTIQYERYNTDGAKICSRKQRTKYDRRYEEEANRARRRGSVSGKPERHTRENFHTHYDSSPLTFGRHEEPMRNLFCTRNKKIETRRKISQSATICRIFLGGKLARSRSSSSSTQACVTSFRTPHCYRPWDQKGRHLSAAAEARSLPLGAAEGLMPRFPVQEFSVLSCLNPHC